MIGIYYRDPALVQTQETLDRILAESNESTQKQKIINASLDPLLDRIQKTNREASSPSGWELYCSVGVLVLGTGLTISFFPLDKMKALATVCTTCANFIFRSYELRRQAKVWFTDDSSTMSKMENIKNQYQNEIDFFCGTRLACLVLLVANLGYVGYRLAVQRTLKGSLPELAMGTVSFFLTLKTSVRIAEEREHVRMVDTMLEKLKPINPEK